MPSAVNFDVSFLSPNVVVVMSRLVLGRTHITRYVLSVVAYRAERFGRFGHYLLAQENRAA